jgi:hypothetical protein
MGIEPLERRDRKMRWMPMPMKRIRPPGRLDGKKGGKGRRMESMEKREMKRIRTQVKLGWGGGGRGEAGREREGSKGSVEQIGIHAAI